MVEIDKRTVGEYIHKLVRTLKPSAVVINHDVALLALANQKNLSTCRGSIYHISDTPCIVLDHFARLRWDDTYGFILNQDLQKLKRWLNGNIRREPRFDYKICTSIADVEQFVAGTNECIAIAADTETGASGISSMAYTCLYQSGHVRTWVVPIVNPLETDGCFWRSEEEEIEIWRLMKILLENPVPKFLHNGCYDAAWYLLYKIAVRNFYFDTMHMFHSTWCEVKKALEVVTSICADTYRYWKSEIKGETEKNEKTGKREPKTSVPKTEQGYYLWLRYNGLDSHYTLLSGVFLSRLLVLPSYAWAKNNYVETEWPCQIGPYFAMTMRGLRVNEDRQFYYFMKWMGESAQALQKLRTMADDPEFNPNSSDQVMQLIYDVLGGKMPALRGKMIKRNADGSMKRSADEKILKFVQLQHPLLDRFIRTIWNVKKPANNASKYGRMELRGKRFMYSLNLVTESGRCNSTNHPYWIGSNAQNIPSKVRDMFIADPGTLLAECDYSQSDAYFVAFYSQDERFINNVLSPEDTHCLHAEFFFNEPYEKVYKAHKADDPWASDPITGIRQCTKRITHGANYQMSGGTLYIVMGHEAVVATALAMGRKDVYTWTITGYNNFCQELVNRYLNGLYPGLPKWFKTSCEEAIRNQNRVTVYGGRTRLFLGNLASDPAVKRELSSYFGQGGTAGNINRTVKEVWYNSSLELPGGGDRLWMLLQGHDSLLNGIEASDEGLRALDQFLTIMGMPVTIASRTFTIPVDCKIGLSWKHGTVGYKPGMQFKDIWPKIQAAEIKLNAKFAATGTQRVSIGA